MNRRSLDSAPLPPPQERSAAFPPLHPTTGEPAPGKIIIIGGGIAGLSCGCYLQMNGFQTEIFEAGTALGGLCAAWDRGPYTFDGCLRWLVGTDPASTFNRIWRELGALADGMIVHRDEFVRIEGVDGSVLSLPGNLDRLAQELKRIAPEDSTRIDTLTRAARRCAPLEPPIEKPLELMTGPEKLWVSLRYLPMLPVIFRWKGCSITAYLKQYRNRFLREALSSLAGDPRVSALVLVMHLAFRSGNNTAFVRGGSRAFVRAIANRYAGLGGLVRYGARVVSVSVRNGRATGVQCADGSAAPAATVVSCADGCTTIFEMLGGRFVNKHILDVYQSGEVFPALMQVSLGINTTFPDAPHSLILQLAQPLVVDDKTQHRRIELSVFTSRSGFCPAGRTAITARFSASCGFWTSLRKDSPDRYYAEKENILRKIVGVLDRRFPGLARHLEFSDIATPVTFVRHTGNWQGSYEGWLPTPRNLRRRLPTTLPGLRDFYMAGHWVVPGGGLPSAALSGRYVAQLICARSGKTFTATPA